MPIASLVAFGALGLAILTVILGITHHPRWYWASALFMYLFSFMASATIGLYTLSAVAVSSASAHAQVAGAL